MMVYILRDSKNISYIFSYTIYTTVNIQYGPA